MATIVPENYLQGAQVKGYCWLGVTENDDCAPIAMPGKGDKTLQVDGDFGVGGEVHLKGTLDPNAGTFLPLRAQHDGQPIAITQGDIVAVIENTYLVCPLVSAGTGVSVNIWVLGREDV